MAQYDFTPEVRNQILAAIKAKSPDQIVCSVCGTWKWTIAEGFVFMPLMENFWLNRRGKGNLVGIALVCERCGHTLFMNLGPLGLEHLVAPDTEEIRTRFGR